MRRGGAWEQPAAGRPEVHVSGGDADLARAVATSPGARILFAPDATSDIAHAVGLRMPARPTGERVMLALDAMRWPGGLAVNMVVIGTAPDRLRAWTRAHDARVVLDGRPLFEGRATTVVIANGEFLRGHDIVPRGHPGDGRLEVHVYALGRAERSPMRRRLGLGLHVPHPRIRTGVGREVRVLMPGAATEVDGRPAPGWSEGGVTVVPGAARLLV